MSNLRTPRQSIAYSPTQNVKARAGYLQPLPVIDPRVVETIPAYQFVVGRTRRQKRVFGDANKLRGSGTLSTRAAGTRKPAARDDAADVARYFC
jgi:hypothetical protein